MKVLTPPHLRALKEVIILVNKSSNQRHFGKRLALK